MTPVMGMRVGGHFGARTSRHVGAKGVAGQGAGSMSFSHWVLHMDPCPLARYGTSPLTRRDTRLPAPPVLRRANTPRAISVPLPPVNPGQQRGTVTRPDHRSRPLTAQWTQPSKLALRHPGGGG
jgi:hypothetical protein